MDQPLQKRLALHVGIALGCMRRTTVRRFAGCGQSRRRELYLTSSIAEAVARAVTVCLAFQKDGQHVILSRIVRHIDTELQGVCDSEARAWAGIDATARDRARHQIADRITRRLCERYTIVDIAGPAILPSSGVWCGLKSDDGKADWVG